MSKIDDYKEVEEDGKENSLKDQIMQATIKKGHSTLPNHRG